MKIGNRKIAYAMLVAALLIVLTGCKNLFGVDDDGDVGSSGADLEYENLDDVPEEEVADVINNGIEFEEESEDAKLHFRASDELEYIGKWEATSGHAIYMYGVLKLNIMPGGKWTGNIVDEEKSGTWKFDNNQMILSSEYFNAILSFTDDGKLVMQENRGGEGDDEDIVKTVLTKEK